MKKHNDLGRESSEFRRAVERAKKSFRDCIDRTSATVNIATSRQHSG